MPVQLGKDLQGCWARWGQAGKKYHYNCGDETARDAAKAKAHRQGAAIGEYTTTFATRKVGFDFDGTLTKSKYRMIAERLVNRGVLVYVISARDGKAGMYAITDELGIPRNRVFAVGANNWYTLGDTTTTDRSTPVTPTGFSGRVQQLGRAGDAPGAIYVLKTDGTVWTWGQNSSGQLGRNGTTNSGTPTQVLTGVSRMLLENYTTYTYGYVASSPIMESGSGYFVTGENTYGQLGVGDATDKSVFTRMIFPAGIRLNKAGAMSTTNDSTIRFAVDTNNNFYAWGYNGHNGVVDSTTTNITVPLRLAPPALVR